MGKHTPGPLAAGGDPEAQSRETPTKASPHFYFERMNCSSPLARTSEEEDAARRRLAMEGSQTRPF